jgi:glyoxylase-like metal-dependent hydrolase (beta-lactamase superfamily II)
MLPSYDDLLEDHSAIEVGRLRLHTVLTPGHTAGSMCFRLDGAPILFSGDTLFPVVPATPAMRAATSRSSSSRSSHAVLAVASDTIVYPVTARRRPSAPNDRTCKSGSTAAGS